MAVTTFESEFPSILALAFAAIQILIGLFSFIYSCIFLNQINIMLGMVMIASGIVLVLTGANVLKIMQINTPLTIMLVVFSAVIDFIKFVFYCLLADSSRKLRTIGVLSLPGISLTSLGSSSSSSTFAISIVLLLLCLGHMVLSSIFIVFLAKHHQRNAMTNSSPTTVMTSRTVTTTIETPPGTYINQPNSQVPK